jgi:hypothetical protein
MGRTSVRVFAIRFFFRNVKNRATTDLVWNSVFGQRDACQPESQFLHFPVFRPCSSVGRAIDS